MKRVLMCLMAVLLPMTLMAHEPSLPQPSPASVTVPNVVTSEGWMHNIRIGGGMPGLFVWFQLDDDFFGASFDYDVDSMSDVLAEYRYYWGKERMTPCLSLEYMATLKPWLMLGAKFSAASLYRSRFHVETDERIMTQHSTLVGGVVNVHFEWLRRDVVQMYSSVGLGVATSFGVGRRTIMLYDCTYVGLSVGKGFYGYFELGGGLSGMLRTGIGVRF